MTVAITRPDATASNGSTTIGGGAASRHAALNDNSDATYVDLPGPYNPATIQMAEPVLPAGSKLKRYTIRARIGVGSFASDPGIFTWALFDNATGKRFGFQNV